MAQMLPRNTHIPGQGASGWSGRRQGCGRCPCCGGQDIQECIQQLPKKRHEQSICLAGRRGRGEPSASRTSE
jgi:hypothetical protein